MNKKDKIEEGQVQLDDKNNITCPQKLIYGWRNIQQSSRPHQRAPLIRRHNHIDDIKWWLCQTPDPPRIPEFYTLTKIHKPTPVGRPIISGCDGPTERISSFVDYILQPIAKSQKSYLKDTKDFINFVEKAKVPHNVIMVSLTLPACTPTSSRRGYRNCMQSIRNILSRRNADTNQCAKENAQTYTSGELLPILWKRLPSDSRHCDGH